MSTSERIRGGVDRDCDAIVGLIAELRSDEHGAGLDRAVVASAVRSALDCATTSVWVAEDAGVVRGFIVVHWLPFPMLGGDEAYISDLIVGREYRGRGVGSQLVSAAESEARRRSCVRLMLNNRVAAESFQRAFYPKLGFRVREEFANLVKVLRR
jgi:ribosomal protein S18 acetylase RimI-like enzyme